MKFWKYQGAGNDFVMLDQRENQWLGREDTSLIEHLCDRRFGIGADGLILLQPHASLDFEMVYFNADGKESTMCGNGGRCIAAFAAHLGVTSGPCRFWAIDGMHEAVITPKGADEAWVELHMTDVQSVEKQEDAYVLNTGSPHYVRFVESLDTLNMVAEGQAVRYSERWKKDGINVNLVRASKTTSDLQIRTYERGVEDETLACGTGVTAAAIASFIAQGGTSGEAKIAVHTKGGELAVRFKANGDHKFSEIWLCGPAVRVFEGEISLRKDL
jgi:diaminopimelate epimerase